MSLATWLAITEIVWVLGLGTWITLERRSPTATLAWIFALAWFPVIGIPVYLLIGPRRVKRKKLRYRRAKSLFGDEGPHPSRTPSRPRQQEDLPRDVRPLALLGERTGQSGPVRASKATIVSQGDECFAMMERAIDGAKHHIHLEYYIWEPDRIGTRFRDLLCGKAKSGVEVRVLLDSIGSAWVGRRFLRPLLEAGGEVAWFNPVGWPRCRPDLVNFRTHRKIMICDGRIGFTGGMNICDEHSETVMGPAAWRDTQVYLEGHPVKDLQWTFLEDWYFTTGRALARCHYFHRGRPGQVGPLVQILTSGPEDDSYAIEKFCFAAITMAKHQVLITTPYFVPNEPLLSALVSATLRGVAVRILVPRATDSSLVTAAARSYFDDLIRVGVEIYQFVPTMLHSKTLVIDGGIGLVGTANMDTRSFRLNFEVAAVFYDRSIAASLIGLFEEDLKCAEPYCQRDSQASRVAQAFARLLSPML